MIGGGEEVSFVAHSSESDTHRFINHDGLNHALQLAKLAAGRAHFAVHRIKIPHIHVARSCSYNLTIIAVEERHAQHAI